MTLLDGLLDEVKALKTERAGIATRLADIDMTLAALGHELKVPLGDHDLVRPRAPAERRPLPRTNPLKRKRRARVPLEEQKRAILLALTKREPATAQMVEDALHRACRKVMQTMFNLDEIQRRFWPGVPDGKKGRMFWYARTNATLDEMERELIENRQLPERPTDTSALTAASASSGLEHITEDVLTP